MRFGRSILPLAAALLALLPALSGCRLMRGFGTSACHSTQSYQKERSVPPLVIPPGLDAPDTTSALRLPKLTEPAPPPRTARQPCLDAPPAFKVQEPRRAPQA